MPMVKRIFALLLLCGALCGCSDEVRAETLPAANYISQTETETSTESYLPTASATEGVIASAVAPQTTVTTTTEETTTTAETTTTTATTEITTTTIALLTSEITSISKMPLAPSVVTTEASKPRYTNTITLNGPNLVYTGESFDFTYEISHRNADRASVLWQCAGDCGTITDDGRFTAEKAGTVVLSVSDISNGLTDSLMVHVVDSPEDVDFVVEVNGIPIANKTYPVPASHNPGLLSETYDAFMELKQAAFNEGLEINFMSGFRSYEEQMEVYAGWNEVYASEADRVSARPGHSEHQLGLAIDVNSIEFSFADTPEGIWLAENCYKFGFIIRYKEGTEHITGYMYEPWHIRYLGKELAEKVHFSGLTLEEYLGIDSWYRIEEYSLTEEE